MAEDFSRRESLKQIVGSLIWASAPIQLVLPANAEGPYGKVRAALADIVKQEPDWGPTLVRLAWHSSGTYDKMSKTGGSQLGTMRFKEEFSHGANAGLNKAVSKLEPLKQKVEMRALLMFQLRIQAIIPFQFPDVSYADLYTLSGVVAIETL